MSRHPESWGGTTRGPPELAASHHGTDSCLCLWEPLIVSPVEDVVASCSMSKVLCYNGLWFGHGERILTCRHSWVWLLEMVGGLAELKSTVV